MRQGGTASGCARPTGRFPPGRSAVWIGCVPWECYTRQCKREGVDVKETPALRALHNRLNRELPALFGDVSAEHDGADYHFHVTVATGGASAETYRSIYAENA